MNRAALMSLQAQGETIENIAKTQDKIGSNIKKGEKIVKGMTTWKGYFKGLVSGYGGKKKEEQKKEEQKKEEKKKEEMDT